MKMDLLTAISPVDGRYCNTAAPLRDFFSESALMRYRVLVETEYFLALTRIRLPQLKNFPAARQNGLKGIWHGFTIDDAAKIKEIEKTTNHDVKSVEYFLQEKFRKAGVEEYSSFIHFGLTSQDINNTAVPLMVKDALEKVIIPSLQAVLRKLHDLSDSWKDIPMLARTHGQPASPTRAGKEIRVFTERIEEQVALLKQIPHTAKFGGATGNFNAHTAAFPDIDWKKFGDRFIRSLGLIRQQTTTQIEHYDHFAALCDTLARINNILINLCRDLWLYISFGYFRQRIVATETGSSTMPHKVNPIDFENAEGNYGVANAIFKHFSSKLPVSRLQRDLTDSTVLRNAGVPFAHTLIAHKSLLKGLEKLSINEKAIHADLDSHWEVISEPVQTILRREGFTDAYEHLKSLTRHHTSFKETGMKNIIRQLKIPKKLKQEILRITPFNYTGVA